MTNNLVDAARLAATEDTCRNPGLIHKLADEIERLTAENAELRRSFNNANFRIDGHEMTALRQLHAVPVVDV